MDKFKQEFPVKDIYCLIIWAIPVALTHIGTMFPSIAPYLNYITPFLDFINSKSGIMAVNLIYSLFQYVRKNSKNGGKSHK